MSCTNQLMAQAAISQEGLYPIMQDGTLIVQKTAGKFVTSASDWKLFSKEVPKVLQEYFDKGYKVVVFR